jgi:competence protein ComEC
MQRALNWQCDGRRRHHPRRARRTFRLGGVRSEVLWPADSSPAPAVANDDSIVVRRSDGRVHLLLTGDIEKRGESGLVADHAPRAAEFLKVPHHGAKTSSTEPFLAAVAPRIALVSVGEAHPFRNPAEAVMDRCEQAGLRLLRTDDDAAITTTGGQNLEVHTFAELHPR